MKILAIGDITSPGGVEHLVKNLWRVRKEQNVDFCIVNGENASLVSGISAELASELLRGGADIISGGNHTLKNKAAYTYLEEEAAILRPLNFLESAPGHGYGIFDVLGYRVLVMCAVGNIYMESVPQTPFCAIDTVLKKEAGRYDFAVLDIHAEASGEKLAVAYAYDGKINVVFGTHTHVPTADYRILPSGTGYVTDLGMCGESGGILGMDAAGVVEKMRTNLPRRFTPAKDAVVADGVIFTLDTKSRRVSNIERIAF